MLDVGGGSGAFSYVFTEATPGLKSLMLELPEVCKTGEGIRAKQSEDVQERVKYIPLDATSPDWPVQGFEFSTDPVHGGVQSGRLGLAVFRRDCPFLYRSQDCACREVFGLVQQFITSPSGLACSSRHFRPPVPRC